MADKWEPDWLRIIAGIGVFHYALATFAWGLALALCIKMDSNGIDWGYLFVRAIPCCMMLGGFIAAMVLTKRRRRFTKWLAASLYAITLAWFCVDAYRHDYQIHAESLSQGTGRHTYFTWWWYDDSWDRNR